MKRLERMKIVVGEMVRYERISRGWTQQQLADTVQQKRTTISNIEAGRQSLAIEQFCLIMKALGKKPEDALSLTLRRLDNDHRQQNVEKVVSERLSDDVIKQHVLDTLR